MANPDRGEVDVGIRDEVVVLRYTTNSMRHLENVLGMTLGQIVGQMAAARENPGSLPIGTVQCLFWAALLDKRPEITLEDAGELMDEAGHEAAGLAVGEAFALYMPVLSGEGRGNPPKASRSRAGRN